MCMTMDVKKSESFEKKNAGKEITVWKILAVLKKEHNHTHNQRLCSPYQYSTISSPGTIKSDRTKQGFDNTNPHRDVIYIDDPNIRWLYRGIHVSMNRRSARIWRDDAKRHQSALYKYVIFKCTAHMDDFVGISEDNQIDDTIDGIFMKIRISQEDHNKSMNGTCR